MPPDRHTPFSANLPFLPRLDPDVALVRQFRATGDPALFETLFRKYQTPIFSLVFRMVNGQDAYDLTQDVFYRAMRSLSDFKGDCKFSTWLFTIAKHVCLNHLRDVRQREQTEDYSLDDHTETGGGPELSDPGPAVGRVVETRELQRLVDGALATLPPEQRLLITLRDLEGLSYEEISTITEMSLVNVKSKLHRARLAFKVAFAPYLDWVKPEQEQDKR